MRTICINRLMTLVAFLLLSVVYASAFEVDGINYSITNESLGYPSTNYTITDVNTTFVVDDICYRLIDNTTENVVEVTYGKKYAGKINIPTTIIYGGTQYAVKGIGPRAFNKCSDLTGVSFPNTIEYIGKEAFQYCM